MLPVYIGSVFIYIILFRIGLNKINTLANICNYVAGFAFV